MHGKQILTLKITGQRTYPAFRWLMRKWKLTPLNRSLLYWSFVRQSGATFRVEVEYPWLPPTCSHCKELGQILKDCLKIKRQWVPVNKEKGTREASTNSDQVVVTIHEPNSSATTPIEEPVDVSLVSIPPHLLHH